MSKLIIKTQANSSIVSLAETPRLTPLMNLSKEQRVLNKVKQATRMSHPLPPTRKEDSKQSRSYVSLSQY